MGAPELVARQNGGCPGDPIRVTGYWSGGGLVGLSA